LTKIYLYIFNVLLIISWYFTDCVLCWCHGWFRPVVGDIYIFHILCSGQFTAVTEIIN